MEVLSSYTVQPQMTKMGKTADGEHKRKRKHKHKDHKLKKKKKKLKKSAQGEKTPQKSSGSKRESRASSTSSSSRSPSPRHKKKKKDRKEAEEIGPSCDGATSSSLKRVQAPMTKEEWEKQQSVVRRVYDPDTGRERLVKGDGEILEEIVSRDRQREINKIATAGDGLSFQMKAGLLKKT